MGIDDGMPIHHEMAEISVRGTDGQHRTVEHENGMTTRAPIGQHVKMFKQVRAPLFHVKERAYLKQIAREVDIERCSELKFEEGTMKGSSDGIISFDIWRVAVLDE